MNIEHEVQRQLFVDCFNTSNAAVLLIIVQCGQIVCEELLCEFQILGIVGFAYRSRITFVEDLVP